MSRRRKPKEVLDFEREYLFPNGFRETRVNGRDGTGSHLHYLNRVTHKRIEVNTRLNREVKARLIKENNLVSNKKVKGAKRIENFIWAVINHRKESDFMVIWIKIFDRYEPVLYVQKDALRHMTVLYVRTKNTMVDVYMSLDGRLFATRKSVREGGKGMCTL